MRLTVIVPLFNREGLIETALESLVRQRDACELDVLVVNDGSTDRGPEQVRAMAERYPEIRMISTENQGVTKARNVGLRNIPDDAELVTFLDSDDVSPADRIRADLAALQRDPTLQFTYGRMRLTDCIDDARFQPADGAQVATVRGISLSAGMFRTEFLRDMGFFDESLEQSEDTDYLLRAFEAQPKYELTDTVCVYYRQHAGNMTRNRPVAMRNFLRAIHNSVIRRRRNPALRIPADVFDFEELSRIRFS